MYVYVYVCVCIYVCVYVCICMYLFTYVCIYVCMYVCMFISLAKKTIPRLCVFPSPSLIYPGQVLQGDVDNYIQE